jgi:hypothetical protein
MWNKSPVIKIKSNSFFFGSFSWRNAFNFVARPDDAYQPIVDYNFQVLYLFIRKKEKEKKG